MSFRPPLFCCLFATMALVAGPVFANFDAIEMSLDDLVKVRILSTPKFAENADQIPSVVSILKAEDIRIFGWRTLGEALRSLQGFNVTNDHVYTSSGVRGISSPGDFRPRMQILIDGMAINDNIFAGAALDGSFPLDLGLIERIEVVRGPSASVYGGDAMFGVVNVVTRSGSSMAGQEWSLAYGSGANRRLRASWGGELNGTDVLVSASGFEGGGQSLTYRDVRVAGDSEKANAVGAQNGAQVFVRLRGSDWRFTLTHSQREQTAVNGSYGSIFNDRGHFETDTYSLAEIAKDWRISAHSSLHQRFYIGQYAYDADFPYDYSPDNARVINRDKARGNWRGMENRLVMTGWSGQRWTLGVEYKENTRQDQFNYDVGYGCYDSSSNNCLDSRNNSRQFTLYAQDEIQIGDDTALTLGLRNDRLGELGSFSSPRLGLVHDAHALGLFKLLYGTAFRTPSVYERYYTYPSYRYGNASLSPEKLSSLELSLEKRLSRAGKLSATLYSMRIQGLIATDAAGTANNNSAVEANGVELEYEHQWAGGARLRSNWTSQLAADGQRRLDNSPRHMFKFNLAVPTGLAGLMAGLEGQWVSQRSAAGGTQKVAPHFLTNLNFSYAPVGAGWDAGLGIYNLFDKRYSDPAVLDNLMTIPSWSAPQFGRQFQLRTNFRF